MGIGLINENVVVVPATGGSVVSTRQTVRVMTMKM